MVNGRFPRRQSYGFEIVDAPLPSHFAAAGAINGKFTPNQFRRNLREFSFT
jgi:hypothetical protein